MTEATAARIAIECAATMQGAPKDLETTIKVWVKEFRDIEEGLFSTAIKLWRDNERLFPTIADIRKSMRELMVEVKLDLPEPRSIEMSEPVKKIIGIVKSGSIKKAVDDIAIAEEVEYARNLFPEISTETVRKNLPEIRQYMKSVRVCSTCRGKLHCPTNGYAFKFEMRSDGWINEYMQRCERVDGASRQLPTPKTGRLLAQKS